MSSNKDAQKKIWTDKLYGKSERDVWLDVLTELLHKAPKKNIRQMLDLNCEPKKET